ncbi:MAG: leucine-rich repeat domain-containing protein [Treponema sp.]|nr:leucine-rich repeat domain-containing protein [Treponema sp.]
MSKKNIFFLCALITALLLPLGAQTEEDFRVTLTEDGEGAVITRYTGTTRAVIIPDTIQDMPVREIRRRAFNESNITSVVIPEGVVIIGERAFANSRSLTSVTLPETLIAIGIGAFADCRSLTSITLPESLIIIGDWAFAGCTSLTTVTFPEGLTAINEAALNESDIDDEDIPEGVITIGRSAFYRCTSLATVTLPEGLTAVGTMAFAGCSSLTTVTIPDSIEAITFGVGVFSGSPRLTLASQAALQRVGFTDSF